MSGGGRGHQRLSVAATSTGDDRGVTRACACTQSGAMTGSVLSGFAISHRSSLRAGDDNRRGAKRCRRRRLSLASSLASRPFPLALDSGALSRATPRGCQRPLLTTLVTIVVVVVVVVVLSVHRPSFPPRAARHRRRLCRRDRAPVMLRRDFIHEITRSRQRVITRLTST
jgi:hypothetical protein